MQQVTIDTVGVKNQVGFIFYMFTYCFFQFSKYSFAVFINCFQIEHIKNENHLAINLT